jgi:hypothetical protein
MGPPPVAVRCPSCGQPLSAVLAPAPPTQWFPCPNCHAPVPVVVPRDLPPLYSWEVVPGLYPRLPPPRPPRWRLTHVASVALGVAAVLAAVSAGLLGYEGSLAAEPTHYVVSGTVYRDTRGGVLVPAAGAAVVLSVDGKYFATNLTGPTGTFAFQSVPAGGIELNVTAAGPGYGSSVVYTFASRSYSTQTHGLQITLEPGAPSNSTVRALTPFGDLETLLAYVGGATVLFAVAAVLAVAAAVVVRRPFGAVVGVIGAGGSVAAPAILVFLSLDSVYPLVTTVAATVGAAGAFALVLTTVELASRSAPPEPA